MNEKELSMIKSIIRSLYISIFGNLFSVTMILVNQTSEISPYFVIQIALSILLVLNLFYRRF